MKTGTSFVAAALCLFAPATLMAQGRPWLADRAANAGMGIRTGDVELHPSVAGEVGYDSNYFQRSGDTNLLQYPYDAVGRSSALRFRLTPSLTLSTISSLRKTGDTGAAATPSYTFAGGVFASYNEIVGLSGPDDLSKQRHIDGGANIGVAILPQRTISGDVVADFVRVVSPSNDPAVTNSWNRDTLHGGLGVTWRPGGGLFDWRLGYDASYNYFEADNFKNLNNIRHDLNTRGRWRFYPRTALVYDARTNWISYQSATPSRNPGQLVQARLGLSGLMTNQLALMAVAGWATTHYEAIRTDVPENLNTFVGQLEAKWLFQTATKLLPGDATVGLNGLAFGYIRDASASYLADFYRRDRVYTDVSYFVGGQLLLDLQAGYSRITHPTFARTRGASPIRGLSEDRVDAQFFVEYRTSNTFGINATLRYDASLTRANVPLTATADAPWDNLAFSRVTAWTGVRWFM